MSARNVVVTGSQQGHRARLRLRPGPLLLCLGVAIGRAVWLSAQLSGLQVLEVGYLLLADLPVLGALALLAIGEAVLRRPWRLLPLALTIGLLTFYLADVFVVFGLNARLQLSDLTQFAAELWIIRSFITPGSVAMLLFAVGCCAVVVAVPARLASAVAGTGVVLLLVPFGIGEHAVPSHLQKYTGSVLLLGKEFWGWRRQPVSRYRPSDFSVYRHEYEEMFTAPFARTGRNVVLVIVESLSAVDSQRTSGIGNALPEFDRLSREGMLFRNFLANFEASEGGIVALLSGVPPLHFPTASTNTFGEYAMQRAITETFARSGYHCEFLTSVPLDFISMDAYTRSPSIGFAAAAGQHDIARYAEAPRFAFESPADHVLYEELLARLDELTERRHGTPVFVAAVTASSHPPYVDPRGGANTAANAWAYVQDELRWLYDELARRSFFDNGLLVITGDHRKMTPLQEAERERYGESAKARIPLLILGAGVPKGMVDDRLFQQADLLRMLDRATEPGAPLSPFVLWAERYVFVFGVASNASNLQVFEAGDGARRAYRLRLRGADLEWLDRPPHQLAVERAIHRQRAMQQAVRASRLMHKPLDFGRELTPSDRRGVLVGISADTDAGRDPDDPRGSLRTLATDSFDLEPVLGRLDRRTGPFTLTVRAFVTIDQEGEYWFSLFADDESCLAIDKQIVLGCQRGLNEGVAWLPPGLHRFDLRYVDRDPRQILELKWLPPGLRMFEPFPQERLVLPDVGNGGER